MNKYNMIVWIVLDHFFDQPTPQSPVGRLGEGQVPRQPGPLPPMIGFREKVQKTIDTHITNSQWADILEVYEARFVSETPDIRLKNNRLRRRKRFQKGVSILGFHFAKIARHWNIAPV